MEDPSLLEESTIPLEPTEANRGVPLRLGYVSRPRSSLCSRRDYVYICIFFWAICHHDFIPANRLQEPPGLVLPGLVKPLLLV